MIASNGGQKINKKMLVDISFKNKFKDTTYGLNCLCEINSNCIWKKQEHVYFRIIMKKI